MKKCGFAKVSCENECGTILRRSSMKKHSDDCPRRKVCCQYCEGTKSFNELGVESQDLVAFKKRL